MSGVYTFGEVKEKLGISSKELNDLMASNQLNPVRHEGSLKFQQADVEKVQKEKDHAHLLSHNQSSQGKKFYSWDEALTKLQIENEELQRFIEDGDIQACQEGGEVKFSCVEIDGFISNIMDDKTIVMPGSTSDIVVEDDEAMSLSLPQNLGSSISVPIKETYSLDQTLRELQLEEETLQKMVENGEIETLNVAGEVCYVKDDIDMYRLQKQADQTIVMPSNHEIEVEDDDDDIAPIVIPSPSANTGTNIKIDFSATPEIPKPEVPSNLYAESQPAMVIFPEEDVKNNLAPISKPVKETISRGKEFTKSFYTLAEVAQELQIDPDELMEIIKSNEIKTYRMNKLKNIKRSDLLKLCSMQFVQNSMQVSANNKSSSSTAKQAEIIEEVSMAKEVMPVAEIIEEVSMAKEIMPVAEIIEEDIILDDDDDCADAIPIEDLALSIEQEKKTYSPSPKYDNTIVLPLVDDFDEEEQAEKISGPKVEPKPQQGDASLYYSFAEALNVLQMEKEGLHNLLNQGTLCYAVIKGVKSLLKKEVTDYKTNKMIEPTIMMDDSGDDVLEEENDDDIFFIS